ncbi:DUF2017 domain-containing protein [Nocardioides sp. GY 10127]|uniref:DUF2017 domain-containing protein n=1 Tax=Nocardioides sp. GY 10127 TaxID=2569762 RepID=UPI0010A845CA|nr:DUF2017 domain-containing protein [Nocardioides sp. GY 10127]TIC81585.1 DUF2017 domain-containing protein [Nocardioides sp. GY 10127]
MGAFTRHRRSKHLIATFTGFEADLLRSLAAQLVELLHSEAAVPDDRDPLEALLDFGGPTTEPDDPVLARLFPTAYPDDEEAAADFRRFTENGLREGKARAASAIIDGLEDAGLPADLDEDDRLTIDVELDEPGAQLWLRSFTDLRLALAVRLGVEEDDEEYWDSLPEDDPRARAHDVYEWVGGLQETLVHALTH